MIILYNTYTFIVALTMLQGLVDEFYAALILFFTGLVVCAVVYI